MHHLSQQPRCREGVQLMGPGGSTCRGHVLHHTDDLGVVYLETIAAADVLHADVSENSANAQEL